jgi:hypothetical protein
MYTPFHIEMPDSSEEPDPQFQTTLITSLTVYNTSTKKSPAITSSAFVQKCARSSQPCHQTLILHQIRHPIHKNSTLLNISL